ncbi:MAG: sigma-70 family RNA polymerase sigma factor [Planctomycetaceae bacterium]|nr:sigma-70 family RNA polymerase sigma factor [Planctomycetaceae bacterium]
MLTTRLSLIHRLQNTDDHEAWTAFVELYYPVIVRSLLRKGVARDDAEDTTQQILVSVSRTLVKQPYDPNRAKFRTWLEKITRHAAINALQRAPRDRALGGTTEAIALSQVPQSDNEQLLEHEYRRQLFYAAAELVEAEFEATTWQAFWRTAVLGESIEAVAASLGKQVGAIYAARSRIIRRLKQEIDPIAPSESP